jgi:autotransporter-associated beta strand protein
MKRHLLLILAFICACALEINAQTFVHPGVPFTTDDLNHLKSNLTKEPWASAYAAFTNDYRSKLTYGMQGPYVTVGRAPDVNRNPWMNDMVAIHNLAFMWIFTGDQAYAQKATGMLDAWAITNTRWTGDETFLDLGDYAQYYITGADILRSTYPGWTADNDAHVRNWFANILWKEADVPNPLRGLNQGAIQIKIAIGIAAYLGDAALWQQAVQSYRTDAGGALPNSLGNGQVGDAGRDEGHWFGQVEALAWSAEVAWKQGVDVFTDLNNRVLATSELYTGFHVNSSSYINNFIPFGGTYAYYTGWGSSGSAPARQSMLYNIIANAYTLRKGVAAPNTTYYRSLMGESGHSFLFRRTIDNSTAPALSPVQHPTTVNTTSLTSIDVGETGLAGKAIYSNSAWTLQGAGAGVPVPPQSQPDAFNFAFQKMNGDGAIIVRVDTILTSANAQAGIMFRESLEEDARHVALVLQPNGGLYLTWRNATAWSKTNISWNNPPGGYLVHFQPKAPWWLKLERINDRVFAYHSQDGVNWTCIGIVVSSLSASPYVGLYTTSQNPSSLVTAVFTNVSMTNSAPAGSPAITSATAATATVGSAFSYAITASASPASYSASGLPAGLSIDTSTGIISGTPTALGKYLVTVNATNAQGTGSAVVVMDVFNNVAPAAPANMVLSNTAIKQVTLHWDASANATSYTVKHALNAGGPYTIIASAVTSTTFTQADAFPGNNYYIVTALSGNLESAPSAEAAITLPPDIPGKPVITNGDGQVTLQWPTATGAASYTIKRAAVSGGPYAILASNVTTTTYVDSPLVNGIYYYYVVSAVIGDRESNNSEEELGIPGATSPKWSIAPVSGLWNIADNWEGGIIPASPAILRFDSTSIATLTNDVADLEVARFSFESEANAYTIAGNAVRMGSEVINKSDNTQVLNIGMTLNGPLQVNAPKGAVRLGGVIAGTGSIAKKGSGWVYLTGANTYSGGTTIQDSQGGWGPNAPLNIAGAGTLSNGVPVAGPLGTGVVTMKGGALRNADAYALIYNDILVEAGTKNFLYSEGGGLFLAGRLTGSGTIEHDGNAYDGLHLSGNNSEFTGTFISVNRSSRHRVRIDASSAGSAKANWILNNSFSDGHRLSFNDTIQFGALSGGGLINSYNAPVMNIGALNTNTTFSGVMANSNIGVVKVGTGTLKFTGTNLNYGATTVKNGILLINGPYNSAVTVRGGTIGGSGTINNVVTTGTGSGAGSSLAPGDETIGQLTVGNIVTLKSDATLRVEFSGKSATMDKLIAKGLTLENAALQFTDIDPGNLTAGVSFILVDNTSTNAVTGIFNGLAELALVQVGDYQFHITYKGGDGNDIVLLDHRTTPALITSAPTAAGMKDQAFSYTITAINTPLSYSATGLPAGLTVNTETGVISGIPTESGIFKVQLGTQDEKGSASLELNLTIQTNEVPPAPAGLSSIARNSLQLDLSWNRSPVSAFTQTYTLKRAQVESGPYTIIAQNLTDTTYSDKSLAPVTVYFYVVSATNAIGEGSNSVAISDTTLFPNISPKVHNVLAVGSNTKINLTWKSSFEAASYNVKRSLTADGIFSTIANVADTSYIDTNITAGTTYYYTISAVNLAGESEPSDMASAMADAAAYAYWPFNEAQGTVATDLWNAKTGTLTGATPGWASGVSGSAVKLAGSSHVALPNGTMSTLTNFTISTWVKLDEKRTWERVFDFGSGTATYMFLTTTHNGGGVRYSIKLNNGSEQQINSSYSVPLNVWVHLAVTLNGSTGILYINGEEVGRNTGMTINPSRLGNTTQTWIGRSQWASDPYFHGTIDDFRIYSRTLSALEISGMVKAIAPLPPTNVTVVRAGDGTALSWTPSKDADSYTVLRGSVAGTYTTIATGVTDTLYTDLAPLKGKNYYVVYATRSNFRSVLSNAAFITMPPAIPGYSHASGWNHRVDLSWAASAGATGYAVKRSAGSEGIFTTIATVTTTIFSDTAVVNGTQYNYTISATNEGGSTDGVLVSAIPVANEVVNTWQHADVGATGISGNARYVDGIFTMHGAGADVWGTADGFHFAYQALTGDGAIVARVTSLENTNTFAKAGVMIRETLNANAKHAMMDLRPDGGVEFIRRTAIAGSSVSTTGATLLYPHWVKLVRQGNVFSAYRSTDGSKWTLVGTETIAMNEQVYIGIAICSHNTSVIAEASFDHVNIATVLPAINSASTANGMVTIPFVYTISATNMPYQFSATALPDSLVINKETGIISGTPVVAGTFPVIITAANALGIATDTLTLTIAKKTQSVSFEALAGKKLGDRDFQLHASATSGLTVAYTSSDTTIVTIANDIVHIKREGSVTITASQSGNEFYEPATAVSHELVIIKLPHTPYGGTARVVPGVVEAEDFDIGGEGKAYHETTDWNLGLLYRWNEGVDIELCKAGGYDVFLTATGEWLKYTIDVQEDGNYQLGVYLADLLGKGKIRIEIDGVDKTGSIAPGKTGGLQKWVTLNRTINLTAGLRVVTIFFESGGISVNKLVFSKETSSARASVEETEIGEPSLFISMYPNPVEDHLQLVVDETLIGAEASVIDNRGVKMKTVFIQNPVLTLDMTSFTSGVYILRLSKGRDVVTRKVIKK